MENNEVYALRKSSGDEIEASSFMSYRLIRWVYSNDIGIHPQFPPENYNYFIELANFELRGNRASVQTRPLDFF